MLIFRLINFYKKKKKITSATSEVSTKFGTQLVHYILKAIGIWDFALKNIFYEKKIF